MLPQIRLSLIYSRPNDLESTLKKCVAPLNGATRTMLIIEERGVCFKIDARPVNIWGQLLRRDVLEWFLSIVPSAKESPMFTIETERLRLRLFQSEDVNDYFTLIHNDIEVMRYITGKTLPIETTQRTIERYQQHFEQYGYTVWAVMDNVTGDLTGHGGLITLPTGTDVEIDYGFGKSYWGKGYATEVARALFRYGFEEAGLPSIYALAFPANHASIRVMHKLGMTYQGNHRRFYNVDLETYTLEPSGLDTRNMVYRVNR
jgi:ribosomal-protein-alanine N-acetyltransferase